MNMQITPSFKRMAIRLFGILMLLSMLLPACHSQPERYRVEEIAFQAGEFTLVGDLLLPEGNGPIPVILFLEGSVPNDRYGWWPLQERILQAGNATFIWDAPGVGESTGTYNDAQVIDQRAQILLAAIDVVRKRPEIDPQRIGLLGGSQGGYVMSRALAETDEVAFVVCISCPGMAGNDQTAYQLARMAFCDDPATEADPQVASLLAELRSAAQYETYEEYLHYWETLDELAEITPANLQGRRPVPQEIWEANPLTPQTYWNPMQVIEQTGIPILSIVGERDRNIDHFQAAYAWEHALAQGGNPQSRLAVIPGVDHSLFPSQTGCPAEMEQLLERYAQSKGYDFFDELYQAQSEDPYQPGAFADFPWEPEVLELVKTWLRDFQ